MKITGAYVDHASGKVQSHSVELTEQDIYLLGFVLDSYKPDYQFQADHASRLRQQVRDMQADY